MVAAQGNLGEVTLLAQAHPAVPAIQNGHWGIGVDGEASTTFDSNQIAASISVPGTFKVENQAPTPSPTLVPVQNQSQVSLSAPAAALPDTPLSTLNMAPVSVPVEVPIPGQDLARAPIQAPVSAAGLAPLPPKGSDSAICEPKLSAAGLASVPIPVTLPVPAQPAAPAPASVPAPVLQPAGIQTALSVAESASLATTQQNLASSTLQHEPSVEVGMTPKFARFQV